MSTYICFPSSVSEILMPTMYLPYILFKKLILGQYGGLSSVKTMGIIGYQLSINQTFRMGKRMRRELTARVFTLFSGTDQETELAGNNNREEGWKEGRKEGVYLSSICSYRAGSIRLRSTFTIPSYPIRLHVEWLKARTKERFVKNILTP